MPRVGWTAHVLRGRPLPLALALLMAGCGSDVESDDGTGGGATSTDATGAGAGDPGGDLEVLHPGAPPLPGQSDCTVEVRTNIPVASAQHVEICSDVAYPTNPPSGGDHWPRWAAFASYDAPIRAEMLVHDLEHGAIVMLHACEGCTDEVTAAFQDAQDAHGLDQKCLQYGVSARFIVAPDPDLAFPVAMAAWGATYNATCIDPPSIAAFVEAHYAGGTEDICAPGVDPTSVTCP